MASIFDQFQMLQQIQRTANNQSALANAAEEVATAVQIHVPDAARKGATIATKAYTASGADRAVIAGVADAVATSVAYPVTPVPIIVCNNPLTYYEELNIPDIVSQISEELSIAAAYPVDIADRLLNIDYLNAIRQASPLEISLQKILDVAITIDEKEFPDLNKDKSQETFTIEDLQNFIKEQETNQKEAVRRSKRKERVYRISCFVMGILFQIFLPKIQDVVYSIPEMLSLGFANNVIEERSESESNWPEGYNLRYQEEADYQSKIFYIDENGEVKVFEVLPVTTPSDARKE